MPFNPTHWTFTQQCVSANFSDSAIQFDTSSSVSYFILYFLSIIHHAVNVLTGLGSETVRKTFSSLSIHTQWQWLNHLPALQTLLLWYIYLVSRIHLCKYWQQQSRAEGGGWATRERVQRVFSQHHLPAKSQPCMAGEWRRKSVGESQRMIPTSVPRWQRDRWTLLLWKQWGIFLLNRGEVAWQWHFNGGLF